MDNGFRSYKRFLLKRIKPEAKLPLPTESAPTVPPNEARALPTPNHLLAMASRGNGPDRQR